MKRTLLISITLVVITICVIAILQLVPKQYAVSLVGLKYQLGDENKDFEEPIYINIDGKLQKSLTGSKTFTGTIDIHGEKIPVPLDQRELVIKFQEDGAGHIIYSYIENGIPGTYGYGTLYINKDFSEVTITTYERDEVNTSKGGWTSEDGFMITAPAITRAEALEISNKLMKDYLKSIVLL